MATGFGDMQGLLRQAQEMQRKLQEIQRSLGEQQVEGSAGGGAVRVVVNGNQDVLSVRIQPAAVDPADVETLEALVAGAVKQAMQAAKQLRDREMQKVTGGLNLPGMGF